MNLDPRIIEGKRVLTPFDIREAEQFDGRSGYFSNVTDDFRHLENAAHGVLNLTFGQTPYRYIDDEGEASNSGCLYFLPEEWVKEEKKEPKYRPFTLAEWIDQHEIGEVIHYRSEYGEIELRQMYVGTRHSQGIKNVIVKITLGNESHTLDYLFENYEIEVNGEWLPFGVLEE